MISSRQVSIQQRSIKLASVYVIIERRLENELGLGKFPSPSDFINVTRFGNIVHIKQATGTTPFCGPFTVSILGARMGSRNELSHGDWQITSGSPWQLFCLISLTIYKLFFCARARVCVWRRNFSSGCFISVSYNVFKNGNIRLS